MSRTRRIKIATRRVQRLKVVRQRGRRAPKPKLQAPNLPPASVDLSRLTYLTIPETFEYIRGTSIRAVYMWARRHKIPKCYVGRTLRFLRRDLDEALQKERQEAMRAPRGIHEVGA